MKTPFLVLAASLAINVLLGGALVWTVAPRAPAASTGSAAETGGTRAIAASVAREDGAGRELPPATGVAGGGEMARIWALFNAGDTEGFVAALRAAGMPDEAIRSLVREQISARYRAQIRAIEDEARGADRPYWQRAGRVVLSAAQRAEIRDLQRAMRNEMEQVLGEDPNRGNRSDRYAYLSEDKAATLGLIESDYAAMMRETREAMQGFSLPSDRETLRLLQEEQRADLVALLSPAELLEYDMRRSPLANRLQREIGALVATEEEYRAIYQVAAAFEQQFGTESGAGLDRRDRATAEGELRRQILEMLGPERAAQYAQQRDPDYRTLEAASVRLNLPVEATTAVIDMRTHAAQVSQQIAANPALDEAAKRAALQQLAGEVQAELRNSMGIEGGDAFAGRSDWVRALQRGRPFDLRSEGGVTVGGGGRRGANNGGPRRGPGGG